MIRDPGPHPNVSQPISLNAWDYFSLSLSLSRPLCTHFTTSWQSGHTLGSLSLSLPDFVTLSLSLSLSRSLSLSLSLSFFLSLIHSLARSLALSLYVLSKERAHIYIVRMHTH